MGILGGRESDIIPGMGREGRQVVLTSGEMGSETHYAAALRRRDCLVLPASRVDEVERLLEMSGIWGLLAPSLARLGWYGVDGPERIKGVLELASQNRVARVAVVTRMAETLRHWERLGTKETTIKFFSPGSGVEAVVSFIVD